MKKEESKLIGQVDQKQIDEWKAKYNKDDNEVVAIVVDGHIGYLKPVDRKTLSYASSVGAKDPLKFNEVLLNNCWLGGSEEIKTNDTLFLSVGAVLSELIKTKEANLLKL